MSTQQIIPSETDLTSALLSYRSTHPDTNAKQIIRTLQTINPNWIIRHNRMVKVLKKEKGKDIAPTFDQENQPPKNRNVDDEDDRAEALENPNGLKSKNVFSPSTIKRISNLDSPLSTNNVLPTNLRSKSSLSFGLYGSAYKSGKIDSPVVVREKRREEKEEVLCDPDYDDNENGENDEEDGGNDDDDDDKGVAVKLWTRNAPAPAVPEPAAAATATAEDEETSSTGTPLKKKKRKSKSIKSIKKMIMNLPKFSPLKSQRELLIKRDSESIETDEVDDVITSSTTATTATATATTVNNKNTAAAAETETETEELSLEQINEILTSSAVERDNSLSETFTLALSPSKSPSSSFSELPPLPPLSPSSATCATPLTHTLNKGPLKSCSSARSPIFSSHLTGLREREDLTQENVSCFGSSGNKNKSGGGGGRCDIM